MRICICGGGSLGHVCAAVAASQGHEVVMFTGHPEAWNTSIEAVDNTGKIYSGHLAAATADAREAVADASIVLLCQPGYIIGQTLTSLAPWLSADTAVGSIVSSTGFFFEAHHLLPSSTPLFGFQRVPFIARVDRYGSRGRLLGYKPCVKVAMENISDQEEFTKILESVFITPVEKLDNYLEASLTNSNPILHTGRLYSLWHNDIKPVKEPVMFYADWTDDASQTIMEMDREFMALLHKLNVREGAIPSLLDYYESTDASSLTRKIRSIEAFKSIKAPMVQVPGGWLPDFSSRYFTEDFPYGLAILRRLAASRDVEAPTIEKVASWGNACIGCQATK